MSAIKVTQLNYKVGDSSAEFGITPVQKALREGMEWEAGREFHAYAENEESGRTYVSFEKPKKSSKKRTVTSKKKTARPRKSKSLQQTKHN